MQNNPVKIFIAYARKDREMLEELRKQFTPLELSGKTTIWYDGEIKPGEKWDEKIQNEIIAAEVILLLVSPDSISSKYFYESEVQKAIQRDHDGDTKVIPVILRPCLWQETPISELQALPKNGNAIMTWTPVDSGYFNVVESLKTIIDDLLWNKQSKYPETISKTFGTLYFTDSEGCKVEYQGDIIQGKANGYGIAKSLGQSPNYEYKGHYRNNLRHDDNAYIIWDTGDKYNGSFIDDKRTGKGTYSWDNGNKYVGDFLDNVFTGIGRHETTTIIYEGEMKGLSFHKKGRLVDLVDKSTYEGDFWEGKKNGKGKLVFENGWKYEGEFLDNQLHGSGRRVLPNGVIYEGEFRKGNAHGKGRMFTEQFEIYEGLFDRDKVNTNGLLIDEDGNRFEYEGVEPLDPASNSKRRGKVIFFNGDIFEGEGGHDDGYYRFKGVYLFSSGVKVSIEHSYNSYRILSVLFPNEALIKGDLGELKTKGKIIFGRFFIFETYQFNPNFGYNNFYTFKWPNGKFLEFNLNKFIVNSSTGELMDSNGNIIESHSIEEASEAKLAPGEIQSEKAKPWWQRFLK